MTETQADNIIMLLRVIIFAVVYLALDKAIFRILDVFTNK